MEEFYDHDQGSYFPMPMLVICGIICFTGLIVISESLIVGIPMFLIGLFVVICRCGIEVDFTKNKYRDYWGPMIFKIGNWEEVPEIEYISVFRARTSQIINSRVSSMSYDDEEIQVNLVYAGNKRITVFETDSKRMALDRAWKFAEKLNTGILDATERNSEWIKAK